MPNDKSLDETTLPLLWCIRGRSLWEE